MNERLERKESVNISFRVYCNDCDFERDFPPLEQNMESRNEAMEAAVEMMNFHHWRTNHDVDVKVVRD